MDEPAIAVDGFLADSVVSVQGKLYVLGAGWNRITAAMFPARHDRIGIGLLVRLASGADRTGRSFSLQVIGPEGAALALGSGPGGPIDAITGEFTAGGAEEQVVPLAVNLNGLELPKPGAYRIEVSIADEVLKRLAFEVHPLAERPTAAEPGTGTAGYL